MSCTFFMSCIVFPYRSSSISCCCRKRAISSSCTAPSSSLKLEIASDKVASCAEPEPEQAEHRVLCSSRLKRHCSPQFRTWSVSVAVIVDNNCSCACALAFSFACRSCPRCPSSSFACICNDAKRTLSCFRFWCRFFALSS